jgi:lipoprotein NlpD
LFCLSERFYIRMSHNRYTAFISWLAIASILLLSACGSHYVHVVEKGETLYSIGWAYGKDYRDIARWNGIAEPYNLSPGQRLRIVPPMDNEVVAASSTTFPQENIQSKHVDKPAPVSPPVPVTQAANETAQEAGTAPVVERVVEAAKAIFKTAPTEQRPAWHWPAKGPVKQTFSASDPRRQGVDIAGQKGNPISAAASGRVVYAGSGLQRYGKLIIVKHNETFLSAYAHNDKLRVKEGEMVTAGQHIADMGDSGTNHTVLHFEIRQDGKPVDPLRYLPRNRK